ncbi:hypothetical protein [Singulisphaera sp. PoT]|uniref:hypothetical protein n=1 Tax=Singulisphaera sp. PoT TaxID=3411797 RepID=UPI003BF58EE7
MQTIAGPHATIGGDATSQREPSESGPIRRVVVNGVEAKLIDATFGQWVAAIDNPGRGHPIEAQAEDAAKNKEPRPHRIADNPS